MIYLKVFFVFLTLLSGIVWLVFDMNQFEPVAIILGSIVALMEAMRLTQVNRKAAILIGVTGFAFFIIGIFQALNVQDIPPLPTHVTNANDSIEVKGNENIVIRESDEGDVIINLPLENLGFTHIPIPKINGNSYNRTREILIDAGWQPVLHHWSYADSPNIQSGNGPLFWKRGYLEVVSCSGTGYAFCRFEYIDQYGNKLVVISAGVEDPDGEHYAMIDSWSIENEN